MNNRSKWRICHRKVLVDTFQLRLVAVGVLHFLFVIVIFIGALFAPIVLTLKSGDISSPYVQAAAREFLVLHTRLWVPLLGAFILLVLHNILVTHRVAGPLYRLRRYLKAVGEGDLSAPMKVRESDYLHKEAEVTSRMVESLREKIVCVEDELDRTKRACAELKSACADMAPDDVMRKIDAVGDHLDACRSGMAAFETGLERPRPAKTAAEPSEEPVELEAR